MESFGYAIIEAMSFGMPIVASKTGGIKEIIVNNLNGFWLRRFFRLCK